MSGTIRWGILGTGSIAHKFADGLRAVPDAELAAVGSRAQGTADVFGDEFEVPRRHASYQSLAEDPEVDAIYVSTPHPMHCENTLLCLNADSAMSIAWSDRPALEPDWDELARSAITVI